MGKSEEDIDEMDNYKKRLQQKKRVRKKKKKPKGKKGRRHYENDSDQEYVQNMTKYVEHDDDEKDKEKEDEIVQQKMPQLVQSKSLSVDDSDDDAKKEEVVHIVHENVDSSNSVGSDTDFSDNGSLNALSSSDSADDDGAHTWI